MAIILHSERKFENSYMPTAKGEEKVLYNGRPKPKVHIQTVRLEEARDHLDGWLHIKPGHTANYLCLYTVSDLLRDIQIALQMILRLITLVESLTNWSNKMWMYKLSTSLTFLCSLWLYFGSCTCNHIFWGKEKLFEKCPVKVAPIAGVEACQVFQITNKGQQKFIFAALSQIYILQQM